jgi:hypothetical protein
METTFGRWGRLAALAVVAALAVALVDSVRMQGAMAPASSREAEVARRECGERLVRAAERARQDGELDLVRWIEALPTYPKHVPVAAAP